MIGPGRGGSANAELTPPSHRERTWTYIHAPVSDRNRALGLLGWPEALCAGIADEILGSLGDTGFDFVQGHGMYEFWAGGVAQQLAQRLEVPFTVTLHGSDVNQLLSWRRPAFRRVAHGAAGLLFVSEALRQAAGRRSLVTGRSATTPNGVDVDLFNPEGRSKSRHLRVLFVGSLTKVKGADRIPGIVRAVRAREPQASFRVIGTGRLRPQLEAQLRGSSTELLGHVPSEEVAAAMRETDVVVIPSRNEGWSCVALEAQACGARVVATDVGGLPESVATGGALVPAHPFDAEQAAQAVVQQWNRRDLEAIVARAHSMNWDDLGLKESAYLHDWA